MKWWKITIIIYCLSLTITNSISSLYTVSEKKREIISPLVLVKLVLFLIIIFSDACVNLLSLKNHSKNYTTTYTPAKTLTITKRKGKITLHWYNNRHLWIHLSKTVLVAAGTVFYEKPLYSCFCNQAQSSLIQSMLLTLQPLIWLSNLINDSSWKMSNHINGKLVSVYLSFSFDLY